MYRRFVIGTVLVAMGIAIAGVVVVGQTPPRISRPSASAGTDPQKLLDRVYEHVSQGPIQRPDSQGVVITQADLDTTGTTVGVAVAESSMLPAAKREFGVDGISYYVSSTVIMAGHGRMPTAN